MAQCLGLVVVCVPGSWVCRVDRSLLVFLFLCWCLPRPGQPPSVTTMFGSASEKAWEGRGKGVGLECGVVWGKSIEAAHVCVRDTSMYCWVVDAAAAPRIHIFSMKHTV